MANPVTYNPSVAAEGSINASGRVVTPPLNNTGAAIAAFGSSLDNVTSAMQRQENARAQELKHQQDQEALMGASAKASQAGVDADAMFSDMQKNAGNGAPDFVPKYLKSFDDYRATTMEGVTDPKARFYLTERFDTLRSHFGQRAVAFQGLEGAQYQADTLTASANNSRTTIYNNPALYESETAARKMEVANAAKLEPNQRRDLMSKVDVGLRHAGVMGYINVFGPESFLHEVLPPSSAAAATAPPSTTLPAGWTQENLRNAAMAAKADGKDELLVNMNEPGNVVGTGPMRPFRVADVLDPPNDRMGSMVSAARMPGEAGSAAPKTSTNIPAFNAMTPEEKQQFITHAQTLFNRDVAVDRARITSMSADADAMAQKGLPFPAVPSPDRIMRAFGPDEGPRVVAKWQQSQTLATDASSYLTMPGGQIVASINAAAPTVPTGFANAEHYQQERQRIAKGILKQREDDAPGYVLGTSPQVLAAQQAATAVNGDQNATDIDRQAANNAYITQSLAEQARLGITNTAILRKEQVQSIVDAVSNHTGSGDQTAQVIKQLEGRYGKTWWPQVYKEVALGFPKDRLPDSFLIVPAIQSPSGREEASRMDGVDLAKIKAQLAPGDEKAIADEVNAQLKPWSESMFSNETNTRLYAAGENVALKIAIDRRLHGMDIKSAAATGAKTITGQYEFPKAGSSARYAVPVDQNPEVVSQGAQIAINNSALWNLKAPPDLTDKRTPAERDQDWGAMVTHAPMWVTNGDETGLKLYATDKSGRPQPVQWPSGKQIEFDWAGLRSFVEEQDARRKNPSSPASPGSDAAPSVDPYIGYPNLTPRRK